MTPAPPGAAGPRLTRAFPLVVSGPSGVGKTSLVERVLSGDPGIRLSLSVTTRPPRAGERPGEDYTFVDREEFERRIAAGGFLEWAEVHGHWYGTPREPVEKLLASGVDVLLEIDVQGAMQVRKAFAEACLVFVLPPSWEALAARLRGRGRDGEEEVQRRLAKAAKEIAEAPRYDYAVMNADLETAAGEILGILAAERRRLERLAAPLSTVLGPAPQPPAPSGSVRGSGER
jgi:guanylate kinase